MTVNVGAVVAGAIGCVVFAILIVITVICIVRYMRMRKQLGHAYHKEKSRKHEASIPLSTFQDPEVRKLTERPLPLITPAPTPASTGHVNNKVNGLCEPDNLYVNTAQAIDSLHNYDINVKNYWDEMSRMLKETDQMSQEFLTLSKELLEPCTIAENPAYKKKCRFKGMMPYDHNRVVLALEPEDDTSHFINASYFDGYVKPKSFIAAQGPVSGTLNDFWRMIWETETDKILMLTNLYEKGQKKCDKYWPDEGKESYGDVTVSLLNDSTYPDYVIRTLNVTRVFQKKDTKQRIVKQFHFTSWFDHDVPDSTTTLLNYWELVMAESRQLKGTTVVHCSAGVGRTGTYLAYSYLIEELKKTKTINIHDHVDKMRHQRPNMVQTLMQYTFVYRMVRDGLACRSARISVRERDAGLNVSPNSVRAQYQILEKMKQELNETTKVGEEPENADKNRSRDVIASDQSRVTIRLQESGHGDYINAVFVPTYAGRYQLIATTFPPSVTASLFWSLVHEYRVKIIVAFRDAEMTPYWPDQGETIWRDSFTVDGGAVSKGVKCVTRDLTVTKGSEESLQVQLIDLEPWDLTRSNTASTAINLVKSIMGGINEFQSQKMIVHCLDGVSHCGLFSSVLSAIERLTAEKIVNPLNIVRDTRRARKQFVTSLTQYDFLIKLIADFSEQNTTYENL